jgi:hypothetical protein
MRASVIALVLLLSFTVTPAHAYLGPGMGVGALAVMFSIVGAIFLALFAVIWYPIKRLLRRGKSDALAETPVNEDRSAKRPRG